MGLDGITIPINTRNILSRRSRLMGLDWIKCKKPHKLNLDFSAALSLDNANQHGSEIHSKILVNLGIKNLFNKISFAYLITT